MKLLRFLALIAGAVLSAVAMILLWQERFVAWTLTAHLVSAALWGWGLAQFLGLEQRSAWWLPASTAAIAPVAGPLASLALVWLLRRPPQDHTEQRYLVWNEQPVSEKGAALPSGGAGQSIVAILQSPRTELRRRAVLALRELDPQLAIPLLRKGLQDSDEQVRIYTQNILSALIERFEGGLKELEQRFAAEPNIAIHAVRVAEQYYELVYLNVAGDEQTAGHYLTKALALLTRAAELAPDDREIGFLALKCALRARDLPAAQTWFRYLETHGYDSRQVLPWQMELMFLQGDWKRLQELFRVLRRSGTVNPRIESLAQFWLGPADKAAA